MSKFLMRITGLCAFVPRDDIRNNPKKNQMRLLLVESSKPADLPAFHAFHAHEPHVPIFLCPFDKVDLHYRNPDIVYNRVAGFYLEDQDLKIRDAKDHSLEVVLRNNAGRGCHDLENISSFEWVTPLAQVSPGSEVVPDSCFRQSAVDSSVIARVELREGKIRTAQIAVDSDDRAILWEFKVPYSAKRGSGHYQVAADIVEFEVDVQDSVELVTSLLRPSSNPRVSNAFHGKSELTIRLTSEGADIDTWVKNMPWADILGTRRPQRYEQEPDVHFSHFYKLSSEYKDANVPHAHGRCDHAPVPHQGNPNCQPVRTAPNPNA
jgi:hypothetical protein